MKIASVGEVIGNHKVLEVKPLPHLQGHYIRLEHVPTGARHIHIACPDDNNCFNVAFPTVPQDSTGVAHILEHIVLAGSERYPVRDPFFSMIPRSLATFINALTAPDHTQYPFSTRNEKDFYNLLEVYLDACFFPRIDYEAYRQEAWRYEFSEMENPDSSLKYGGVVFNEMKGQTATPQYLMHKAVGKAIFPDLTYSKDSGGDPRFIPDLSWEGLKAFHARHYHPSNAFFFTYGNLPLEKTLGQLERLALSRFEKIDPMTRIPDQPRFGQPGVYEAAYPLSPSEPPEKKSQALVAWLGPFVGDSFQMLAFKVLERVLLANAASPLRKALLESRLGEALADGTGYHDHFRQSVFAAGLRGINTEDAGKVEDLIFGVLKGLSEKGVDKAMVEAAIHRLEIESREVSNAGWPYPLKVFFQIAGPYLNGGDPYQTLQFDADLSRLRAELEAGPFFENLIREHFLENTHRARIVLKPDQTLTERLEAEERAKLDKIRSGLSEEQVRQIIAEAKALKARQEAREDKSVLPTLALSDVPMTLEDVSHQSERMSGAAVGFFPQPTNGLSYLDIQFDVSDMEDRLKDLLPLFAFVAPRMGAGQSDYLQMASRIEALTGGVNAGVGLRVSPEDVGRFSQGFTLSGKALYRNHRAFFDILKDLSTKLYFDKAHLKNLLGQFRAQFDSRVIAMGHLFARNLAAAQLGGANTLRERWEGLSQLATLKRLVALDEAGVDGLVGDLEAVRDHLFRNTNLSICVTAEDSALGELQGYVAELLSALPAAAAASASAELPSVRLFPQARTTAVPVAYDGKAFSTVAYQHPDAPVLLVLANLLREEFLHKEIREKGGAYGGFALFEPEIGLFSMLSYRDPNITRTFQIFDRAARYVLDAEITAETLKEAILRSCGQVDPLLAPEAKGRTRFFNDLAGYTLEKRLQFKQRLLQVTLADLKRVAEDYLSKPAALAVISNEEKVKQANSEMGGVFQIAAI